MREQSDEASCVVCRRDRREVPLLVLEYGDSEVRICPQHLPLLIHSPDRLVGLLPGAERLEPAEHHD
jgi:hypothetical protein